MFSPRPLRTLASAGEPGTVSSKSSASSQAVTELNGIKLIIIVTISNEDQTQDNFWERH